MRRAYRASGVCNGLFCLICAFALLFPFVPRVSAAGEPQLLVTPSAGRPGDVYYLAGGQFPPNQPLTVTMWCKDWWYNVYGRWSSTVTVGDNGSFVGARMQVPTPLLIKDVRCVIRARDGDNPFGIGVAFHILSPDVPSTERKIHVQLAYGQPLWNKTATQETINVRACPGARVVVRIANPPAKPVMVHLSLPWTGQRTIRVWVPASGSADRVLARAEAHLGDLMGRTMAWLPLRNHQVNVRPRGR